MCHHQLHRAGMKGHLRSTLALALTEYDAAKTSRKHDAESLPHLVPSMEADNPGRPYWQRFIFAPVDQRVGTVGSPENRPKNTSAESISPTQHLIQKRENF